MEELVLATGNPGKVEELRRMLDGLAHVRGIAEFGLDNDLPETGDTLEANAVQKAEHVFHHTGLPSVADDTGLEVEALNGAPGVYSARYGGPQKEANANIDRLLGELPSGVDRSARFRTVIALVSATGTRTFEGTVKGRIATERQGTGGFGYDPVFIPDGEERTFARMTVEEKNSIGHRGKAMRALLAHLQERSGR